VLAAVIKEKSKFKGKKVCCVLSGGNIDLSIYFNRVHENLNKDNPYKDNILSKSKI
jgi:threonine dehydratase